MEQPILSIRNISKEYPGVKALDDVSFDIPANVVHCIIGENGAGKSTLIKILTGAIEKTRGSMLLHGQEYHPKSIKEAMRAGISVLYQELNVVDELTVEENLTLGAEDTRFGVIRHSGKSQRAYEVLNEIDPSIQLKEKVEKLSMAKKQIVEIAKAVAANASILIMDEPTAALSEEEVRKLFTIIHKLREQKVTVIYISHRLDEIMEIGDYVTVLRDGKTIATKQASKIHGQEELIQLMLGKLVIQTYVPSVIDPDKKVLEVENLTNDKLHDISFEALKGEIVGFYGLVGAGKTEVARALFGADPFEGTIRVDGREVHVRDPRDAIRQGIAMVPEERRTQGLFLELSIKDNIPVMNYKKISRWNIYNKRKQREMAVQYIKDLRIATSSEEKSVSLLSGGNQQKVVLAKCLNADAKVLLLDEPSRGVDVGAKDEIFHIIRELAAKGNACIVFSSELPEILALCDKIILLYEGKIRAVVQNSVKKQPDSEKIMQISTGGLDKYDE